MYGDRSGEFWILNLNTEISEIESMSKLLGSNKAPGVQVKCTVLKTSHRVYMSKGCETGLMVYRLYLRRLGSLTVYKRLTKVTLSPQLF